MSGKQIARNITQKIIETTTPITQQTTKKISAINKSVDNSFLQLKNTWIIKNTQSIIRKGFFQFLGMIILTSFLIMLLNLVGSISAGAQKSSESIKNKLGVYIYIRSLSDKEDEINGKVIQLKSDLEQAGLHVDHHTKNDAFDSLSQKLPSVAKTFEKYGISNPLPQTLYITFNSQQQFNSLKKIVAGYTNIILDYDEKKQQQLFVKQQQTIVNAINFSNLITGASIVLLIMIASITVTILLYLVRVKFMSFIKDIEVQKLLGASYLQIKLPFYFSTGIILLTSTIIAGIITFIFMDSLNYYTSSLFDTSIYQLFGISISKILWAMAIELIGVGLLLRISSSLMLNQLIKEVN